MKFTKMHGLGNDFIITEINEWNEGDKLKEHASFLCDRNFGIGADGFVVIGRDFEYDLFMRVFNPDGSEAEMCGNAIRCIAVYAFENGMVPKAEMTVRTLAGIRQPKLIINEGVADLVKVDMGEPILEASKIPSLLHQTISEKLIINEREFLVTAISMGNPHCIIFDENAENIDLKQWGPLIEENEMFPAKTNVEFVKVINKQELIMRVWERGAGITLACGTGACATLVAAVLNGYTDRTAKINLLGGSLFIEWDKDNKHVYMTGPAEKVFVGSINL